MPPLKKNEKIMLVVIAAALVFFVVMDPYYFIWRKPPAPEGAAAQPAAQPVGGPGAAAASQPKGKTGSVRAERGPTVAAERIELTGWRRDPFVQSRSWLDRQVKLSDLKLGAISVRKEDRYALINSRVVRVGDEIGGMVVEGIKKDQVLLSTGGRTYTLSWED